ncbi:hypothetical protein EYF80_004071 [Liparis tanakae]|uniref:Uncharacterized protein n=1 Tax=Liparis tanakae TaxID=230148 RepID=A0A4Z2J7D6_9TELE|nr:hypothetical protein EYF80_004071 [Liparis tanakae]
MPDVPDCGIAFATLAAAERLLVLGEPCFWGDPEFVDVFPSNGRPLLERVQGIPWPRHVNRYQQQRVADRVHWREHKSTIGPAQASFAMDQY